MILTCPSCTTKFKLSMELLGEEGHTVRCGECLFEWFQPPEQPEEDYEDAGEEEEIPAPPLQKDTPSPPQPIRADIEPEDEVTTAKKTARIFAMTLFVFCVSGLFLMQGTITRMWPGAKAAYDVFGLQEDAILTNEDVAFERFEAVFEHDVLKISGKIWNLQSEPRALPPLIIQIKDSHNEVLEEVILPLENAVIEPEGIYELQQAVPIRAHGPTALIRFSSAGDTAHDTVMNVPVAEHEEDEAHEHEEDAHGEHH